MENITIRKAITEDAEAIAKLFIELLDFHKERDLYYTKSEVAEERQIAYIKNAISNESYLVLAATDKDKIVGYLIALIDKKPKVYKISDFGKIDIIAITKDYRRQGIGEKLFKKAKDWFLSKDIKRIEMNVATTNEISVNFWHKMGFKSYEEVLFIENPKR
jgi:ribosomal protein S18 acetylase RimI-like enzyme